MHKDAKPHCTGKTVLYWGFGFCHEFTLFREFDVFKRTVLFDGMTKENQDTHLKW